jgi:hypothetical protein
LEPREVGNELLNLTLDLSIQVNVFQGWCVFVTPRLVFIISVGTVVNERGTGNFQGMAGS